MNFDEYVRLYAETHNIYWAGGIPWRKYKSFLRPLSLPHQEPKSLSDDEMRGLLRASRVNLALWTYDFDRDESDWWWIVAKAPYSLESLNKKTRYDVRQGLNHCEVRTISSEFLAREGYECHKAAMTRRLQSVPFDEKSFHQRIPSYDRNEAYEIWGVFIEDKLVSYSVCRVIDKVVYQDEAVFDPRYFKYRTSYALIHVMTDFYLNRQGAAYLTTGMRSISHETDYQNYLINKFGYRKAYCNLGLFYSPSFYMLTQFVRYFAPFWKNAPLPSTVRGQLKAVHSLGKKIAHGSID